jgi:dihydroorotase
LKILLKEVKIVDKASRYNGQVLDILVEDGVVAQMAESIETEADEVFEMKTSCVSVGWCDMRIHNTLLGNEHKEDAQSLAQAAIAGGYTHIALLPNGSPVVQSKELLGYIRNVSDTLPISLLPMAAATDGCHGKDIVEYLDLHAAGAVAFTDGSHTVDDFGSICKILLYLQQIDGLFVNHPTDNKLNLHGQMHEGLESNLLGLKGMPAFAEASSIKRHLEIMEYLGVKSKVHFTMITTKEALDLIREAKKQGHKITCDVSAQHLVYTDEQLRTFDSNYKVMPPFRTTDCRDALWAGLLDGTVDAVVSDHCPHDPEAKNVEYDQAEYGIIGIETVFAILCKYNKALNYNTIVEKLSTNPRKILGLPKLKIEEGQEAVFTIFNTNLKWTPSIENKKSKAANSPIFGTELSGKAIAILNKGKLTYAE